MNSYLVGIVPDTSVLIKKPTILILHHEVPDSNIITFNEHEEINVEFLHNGILYSFDTNLTENNTTVLSLDYPDELTNIDYRKLPRFDSHIPANVEILGIKFEALVINISANGCCFLISNTSELQKKFKFNEVDFMVKISLHFDKSEASLDLSGKIKHIIKDAAKINIGMAFSNIDIESRKIIKKYMYQYLEQH